MTADSSTKSLSISPESNSTVKLEISGKEVGTSGNLFVNGNAVGSSGMDIDSEDNKVVSTADKEPEDEEIEEAPITRLKDPGDPTQDEIDRHYLTHLPHRSWCPICIMARGKEDQHRKNKKPRREKPTVSFDYKSFGQEAHSDDKVTAIVIRDSSKTIYAHVCLSKGSSDKWIIDQILEDLDQLGHVEMILKSDGEPALVQVLREVKARRIHNTVLEHPPAYDPQSNGTAEKTFKSILSN